VRTSGTKRFPFLLLDAGPIIKLFELHLWDEFIARCEVTVSRIIAEEQVQYTEDGKSHIDLRPYKEKSLINVLDIEPSTVKEFVDRLDSLYKAEIHDGEKETLAYFNRSPEKWLVCSADHVVYKVLGLLGKGDRGISLEEILTKSGLQPPINWNEITSKDRDWKYTKKFRDGHTQKGQRDFIQGQGLV
jgi:hypothetical protein